MDEQMEQNATEPFSITKGQGHVRAPDRFIVTSFHIVCVLCVLWYSGVDKVGVVFEFH